jgi:hypothetical protein
LSSPAIILIHKAVWNRSSLRQKLLDVKIIGW